MNNPGLSQASQAWQDAQLALMALQVDPTRLGGIWLRAGHGPVREYWLQFLKTSGLKIFRVPGQVDDERLLGGLDLAATLQSGQVKHQPGLLAQAHGGVILLPMAERLPSKVAAHIAQAQDSGQVHATHAHITSPAQFSVIALDESEEDEACASASLTERLGLWLDLRDVSMAQSQEHLEALGQAELHEAVDLLDKMQTSHAQVEALCQTAVVLGVDSLRAPLMALRLACVCAALEGRDAVEPSDLQLAARLVLGPRATRMPAQPQDEEPPPPEEAEEPPPEPEQDDQPPEPPPEDQEQPEPPPQEALEDVLLAAALASLPPKLLDRLLLGKASTKAAHGLGNSGQAKTSKLRGRPLTPRPGKPSAGARLHVLATLMNAAPKQRLRQNTPGSGRVVIRSDDFHVQRYAQQTPSCLIFALDASGSAAQHRLAEAKGAVELLLEQSYARRDSVCVIGFRLAGAQVLLPPTRSLVRAKRALGGLPGGGGTPLASGIQAALVQAQMLHRAGSTPMLVILSDGRANVSLAGTGGRVQARADAEAWAQQWRLGGYPSLWIDTAPQPEPQAQNLARLMGANYFPMPYVQAQRMAAVVQDLSAQVRRP
jgi:magnesium chelatase subunit D